MSFFLLGANLFEIKASETKGPVMQSNLRRAPLVKAPWAVKTLVECFFSVGSFIKPWDSQGSFYVHFCTLFYLYTLRELFVDF